MQFQASPGQSRKTSQSLGNFSKDWYGHIPAQTRGRGVVAGRAPGGRQPVPSSVRPHGRCLCHPAQHSTGSELCGLWGLLHTAEDCQAGSLSEKTHQNTALQVSSADLRSPKVSARKHHEWEPQFLSFAYCSLLSCVYRSPHQKSSS